MWMAGFAEASGSGNGNKELPFLHVISRSGFDSRLPTMINSSLTCFHPSTCRKKVEAKGYRNNKDKRATSGDAVTCLWVTKHHVGVGSPRRVNNQEKP